MSREEFMRQLEELLADIPKEERMEALSYYRGYFEDAGVENEEKILKELESPQKVAATIKADLGMEEEKVYTETGYSDDRFRQQEEVIVPEKKEQKKQQEKQKMDKKTKIILIILIAVVTCPLWIGILSGALGVIGGIIGTIISVAVGFAAVAISLYIVAIALMAVGIGMAFGGVPAAAVALIGAGLITGALAILATIACVWLFGKGCPWLIRSIVNLCQRLLGRKEKAV